MLDEDDGALENYKALTLPSGWSFSIGQRTGVCPKYNEAVELFPNCSWYGVIADDVVPQTPFWDTTLVAEAGTDGFAYPDDGINGPSLACHGVQGGAFARRNGFISLPGLKRLYADNVSTELARERGVLRYRDDVKCPHWHFSTGKSEFDATSDKSADAENDKRIYKSWLAMRCPSVMDAAQ